MSLRSSSSRGLKSFDCGSERRGFVSTRAGLDKRGEGVHLVALAVADLDAAKSDMKARGARVIDAGKQVFLHPKEGHGVMYQLIERK